MYLLDTNVVSELRKPKPHGGVVAWVQAARDTDLYLSAVTLGEIQAGIEITREQDAAKADELTAWLIEAAVRYTGKPVSVPTMQSLPVLFPFTLTRPLAYVISNSPNLDLRSEGPSSQFVALRTTI